jgi:hypothetical protein
MSTPEPVPLSTLIRGYARAFDRFKEASANRDRPDEVFIALFEALNWATSIDERLCYPDNRALRGVRYARNRVHHKWADALTPGEGQEITVSRPPLRISGWSFDWLWREPEDLPEARSSKGESEYRSLLANRHAGDALYELNQYFSALEPIE